MSEKQPSSNYRNDVRSIYQNWVQKLSRGKISYMKWKKRWMVIRSNGQLYSYKERPNSLMEQKQHSTFEIGPESIVQWDKKTKTISLTVGEEPATRERVFRVVLSSNESLKVKESEQLTWKWYNTLKDIALRKRMWYVLQMRSTGQEELKTNFQTIVSPPPLYEQKRVSERLEDVLDEKFDTDCQNFWNEGLKSKGHNIHYEFNDSDIEILWHMYAKHKFYMSNDCLELMLGDAFARAHGTKGTHMQKNSHNFTETISDRAYSAMVFLDSKKKDGFVDFEDFKLINTRAFWKNVDFLTPILPDHETDQLWLSFFQCLEDTGTLSKNIIHRLWMMYTTKDDGYLYQLDLEGFLADFMDATADQWPDVNEYLVERFHKKISTRAAIALRFLTGDESPKVTIEQFAAISQKEFWVYVDFFPTGEEVPMGEEDEEMDAVDIKSESFQTAEMGLTLRPEPSVENIIRSLSGGDLLIEDDSDDCFNNEPEDIFIEILHEPEEKTRIWEETEEKLDFSIKESRDSCAMPIILESIVEKSVAESDLTDSLPDSASDDLSEESDKVEIFNKESVVYSLLSKTPVTNRRHSLRLVHEDELTIEP